MTNLIAEAVEPLKALAIARAEEYANEMVAYVAAGLEAASNDRQICAPHPSGFDNDYHRKKAKYVLYHSLTRGRKGSRGSRDPDFADMDAELIGRFIKDAKDNAAEQYDLYVAKLIHKIGEVKKAELVGKAVWSRSYLTVVKSDGNVEIWKTQMILNVSKLGKVFNQFPTRKVKTTG